jgi:hypothetical protein
MHAQMGVVLVTAALLACACSLHRRPESVAEPQPPNICCHLNHFIYAQHTPIAGTHRVRETSDLGWSGRLWVMKRMAREIPC